MEPVSLQKSPLPYLLFDVFSKELIHTKIKELSFCLQYEQIISSYGTLGSGYFLKLR